jgi:PAS domain S-box-containing protein
MIEIYNWFSDNLALIHLIYGLSFVVMGISILIQPKENSSFKLADILWLFVAYSLIHAPADFIDVWDFFLQGNSILGSYSAYITYIAYIFQFEFGRRILKLIYPESKILSPVLLPVSIILILFTAWMTESFENNLSVAVGYLLRLPAGLMSGAGLILYYNKSIKINNLKILKKYFYSAGLALIFWAFLCGIVRVEGDLFLSSFINSKTFFTTLHIPVHIFRTTCAVILTVSFVGILKIFNWEYKDKILAANLELDEKVRQRTEELEKSIYSLNEEMKKKKIARKELSDILSFQESIINGIADSLIVISNDFKIIMMNKKAKEIFSKSNKTGNCFCHEIINHSNIKDCRNNSECLLNKIKKNHKPLLDEYKIQNQNGIESYFEIIATPLFDKQNKMKGIIEVIRDVTGRKNLEREVIEISEKERYHIARELHDDLGQNLLAIDVISKLVHQKLDKAAEESNLLSDVIGIIDKSIELNRNIAKGLSPHNISAINFSSMINSLLDSFEKVFKIKCEFILDEKAIFKDDNTASQVYKITQEAVKNAIKHGKAANIKIEIKKNETHNILTIEDDGTGIDENKLDIYNGGIGMKIMNYRSDLISGKINFVNNKGSGASVICAF